MITVSIIILIALLIIKKTSRKLRAYSYILTETRNKAIVSNSAVKLRTERKVKKKLSNLSRIIRRNQILSHSDYRRSNFMLRLLSIFWETCDRSRFSWVHNLMWRQSSSSQFSFLQARNDEASYQFPVVSSLFFASLFFTADHPTSELGVSSKVVHYVRQCFCYYFWA